MCPRARRTICTFKLGVCTKGGSGFLELTGESSTRGSPTWHGIPTGGTLLPGRCDAHGKHRAISYDSYHCLSLPWLVCNGRRNKGAALVCSRERGHQPRGCSGRNSERLSARLARLESQERLSAMVARGFGGCSLAYISRSISRSTWVQMMLKQARK